MDMGITKGVEVYVRKVAPLGDPVEVSVRGYELSLRKADADYPAAFAIVKYSAACIRASDLSRLSFVSIS